MEHSTSNRVTELVSRPNSMILVAMDLGLNSVLKVDIVINLDEKLKGLMEFYVLKGDAHGHGGRTLTVPKPGELLQAEPCLFDVISYPLPIRTSQLHALSEEEEAPPIYQNEFHVDTNTLSEICQDKYISDIEGSFVARPLDTGTSRHDRGFLPPDVFPNLEDFVNFTIQHPECMSGEEIKCPCSRTKCRNKNFRDVEVVKLHVLQSGFVPNYYVWIHHGEVNVPPVVQPPNEYYYYNEGGGDLNSEEEIWPGNSRHSPLSASIEILDIKCRHQGSISLIDDTFRLLQVLLPENNKMPKNVANIKKLVKGLGLPGADEDLTHCKVCTFPRWKPVTKSNSAKRRANIPYKKMFYFPLTPRLQRLYASKATANHMTWHTEHEMEDEKMCHPSDSPAWKWFSGLHTDFADETRNIILGLCTDGFQAFGCYGTQYSSWPVIVTPYNLPHGMRMKDEFMFLTILVPGPGNPKNHMDIFLQPLIAELNQLWESGIRTKIGMSALYGKYRGIHVAREWTGDEVLAEVDGLGYKRAYETNAKATNVELSKGRGWNRKSIFWDLPYWKTNVIRHNLDVMHIEKNVFDNGFNTVLNVPGKTKDTAKSRAELNGICDRPGLAQDQETGRYPKALYALDRDSKKILLEWIQKLMFPDGYVSNLSRCVDLNSLKMMGMKIHDCHVFMQRLLPIALRELLPPEVWEPLTELSIFFRELTAT
ncbi:uncharacterized protein LOC130015401 [Mercurialis annua]|uniref:uncharacterized protein LOC130015401 n=1 Tax=Mercurialis annua TaxID=3986 RepID=UPI0024AEE7D6|nr:uncharacterized protein LOC130015401 [Mercurialis annua]